nr:MAG TPA: hypothetical protein [Caudoviricetes sp.]
MLSCRVRCRGVVAVRWMSRPVRLDLFAKFTVPIIER